jgi:hypothetical protein
MQVTSQHQVVDEEVVEDEAVGVVADLIEEEYQVVRHLKHSLSETFHIAQLKTQ